VRVPATSATVIDLFSVANISVNGNLRHDLNPYVTYDSGQDEYLALWELDFNGDGSDFDVYSQKLAADGSQVGAANSGLFGLATLTGRQERNARQVYNASAGEFLITWDVDEAEIAARRFQHTAGSLLLGGTFQVSSGVETRRRPDVAFNSADTEILVAWEFDNVPGGTGFDVAARRLGNQAPGIQVTPTSLDFGTGETDLDLTVTNTGTGTLDWFIATDQPWLSVAPAPDSTSNATPVTLSVDRDCLPAGPYNATVSPFP
ncbi:MAG: BACON domain-containing protein, partial [bacterium]|nr:BACON domain-containing protein [bacterium]